MNTTEFKQQLLAEGLINENGSLKPSAFKKITSRYSIEISVFLPEVTNKEVTREHLAFILKYDAMFPNCGYCGHLVTDLYRLFNGKITCDATCSKQLKVQKWKEVYLAIDPVSGKTNSHLTALKVAKNKKETVNPVTGLTSMQESSNKMKETKRSIKDEFGRDIYQLTAIKTAITRFGQYAGVEGKTDYELYNAQVNLVTKQQPLELLENFDKRGACGKAEDPHQVDHRYSKVRGFIENIPPYIIGHISNLEMLPARTNNSKGSSCSISQDELFSNFFRS